MGKTEGKCFLCSKYGELTFEHTPPKAAFNDQPIYIQKHEHLFNENSPVYGKSMRSNRGAGSYSLCKTCNNNIGTWYSNDYSEFVKQGVRYFQKKTVVNRVNNLSFEIKPLNVLKQILVMFVTIDHMGYLNRDKELVNFLLEKENQNLPEKYGIYIYNTISNKHRMMGIQFNNLNGFSTHSEITFNPFGYVLTIDSLPPSKEQVNIANFNKFQFNQQVKINCNLCFLKTDTMLLGHYD